MTEQTDPIAPLPDGARFDAYYFGFDPTGVGPVDAILSAVAVAGKGSHHTESWSEENDYYDTARPGLVAGSSGADTIQKNAERSAEIIRALVAEIAALKAAAESPTTVEWGVRYGGSHGVPECDLPMEDEHEARGEAQGFGGNMIRRDVGPWIEAQS